MEDYQNKSPVVIQDNSNPIISFCSEANVPFVRLIELWQHASCVDLPATGRFQFKANQTVTILLP
jgi:hypothetical protein